MNDLKSCILHVLYIAFESIKNQFKSNPLKLRKISEGNQQVFLKLFKNEQITPILLSDVYR